MKTKRRLMQLFFLLVTLLGVFVVRGNAERWCPFGGVETLYTYCKDGTMICSLGVSNLYILAAILLLTLLCRRAFCGYICPIGTISEWSRAGLARLKLPTLNIPTPADRMLSLVKYGLLALILYFTYRSSELFFRSFDPCYALISRHGADITFWAYGVAGAIVVASCFVSMPFCRWFCPAAAVFNLFSKLALTRIRREPDSCSACQKCTMACPMAIPVAKLAEVTQARCLSCLNCVDACPAKHESALVWGPPKKLGRPWPQSILLLIILACVAGAVLADRYYQLPSFVKSWGERPAECQNVELYVENLSCRGRAKLLEFYLTRDDECALPGYVKLQAWPGPGAVKVIITYDARQTTRTAVEEAISEPYYDKIAKYWRRSPFKIVQDRGT